MGCGTSINENDVNKPSQASFKSEQDFKSTGMISAQKKVTSQKIVHQTNRQLDSKPNQNQQTKTKKQENLQVEEFIQQQMKQMEQEQPPKPITKIFLFGQTTNERKILAFQTAPPSFYVVNSRNKNPTPVKYAPTQVILQQSQQLFSSHLFCSTSNPPYNFMYATYIKHNKIFLCGGVNFDFDLVSNQAFIYKTDQKVSQQNNTHSKSALHRKKNIGNNLMAVNFQKLPLMRTKRYSHMGVYYKAGKLSYIFIMGGRTQNDAIISKCEKYCFQQNKWTDIADLNMPRSTAFSLVFNKKIYVFGGYVNDGKRTKKIERYNFTADNWEVLSFKLHRGIETGIIFPCPTNGQFLIIGGNVEYGSLKSVIRINFKQEQYVWDSDMKKQRLLQKGIYLSEHKQIYVFGGDFQDTVERYSFKQKTWKVVDKISYSDTVSPDDINSFSLTQETINIDTEDMISSPKKKEVNQDMQYRYIFGTDDYPCIYELNTTKWVLKRKNVPMSLRLRSSMTIAKIKEGKYFLAGGIDAYFEKTSRAAYLFYSGTNKVIQIGKMKEKKFEFSATVYQDKIYIFGGRIKKEGQIISTCEKFDITQNKWIQLENMPRERANHKSILVPEKKKIILFGGMDSYQSVNEIDIFDIETKKFTTLKHIIPIPLDPKVIFPGKVRVEMVVVNKKSDDFEFLEESNAFEKEKEQEEQTEKVEESRVDLTIFSYNYLLKQYTAHSLTVCLDGNEQIIDNKLEQKVLPFSLSFKETVQKEETYFLISEKGVFKWRPGKQVQPQIVINQIQMLQMPIQKFGIA